MADEPTDLTDAEIRAMALNLGVQESFVNKELVDFLRGQITLLEAQTNPTLYAAIRSQMTGSPTPGALAAAQNLADREATTLARGLIKADLNKMGGVIKRGLDAGLGPNEVARRLDMVKGLDSVRAKQLEQYLDNLASRTPPLSQERLQALIDRKHGQLLNARKRTIARTEMRFATGEGNKLQADERGDKWKSWITAGDDRVDEECEGNEGEGWIPIDQEFSSGDQAVPAHPKCRCTLAYRRAAPNEAAVARADTRIANTRAAKEEGAAA